MSRIARLERELRGQTICQAILVGCLAVLALQFLRPVLLPFVLAVFIVSGLTPVLSGIESRFSTTRLVAVVIASVLGLGMVFLLWSILWVSVAQLADDSPQYVERVRGVVSYVRETMDGAYDWMTALVSQEENAAGEGESTANAETADEANGDTDGVALVSQESEMHGRDNPLTQYLGGMASDLLDKLLQLIRDATMEVFTMGTMVVIFVFFLLLGSSQAIPENQTWQQIDTKIREYILSKTLISFFTGIAFAFSLWIFGIPLAIVFGLMAFLFNFIPNIGPILACLLPLPLIVFHPELNAWEMVLAITLSSAVQIISGNVVEPRMMGDSFDVHPIAILLALMFWGLIWGIVGMFLAVPMTAIMKILFAKFEMTKPLADLLAGRVDGTSFREFYFGGDSDEERSNDSPSQPTPEQPGPAEG
ncbi:AI-2E family transporter [Blastopirellula marina]|uniref:AI-2E family transporter n=1 Tax=Blastopirellula marina TaxID=124 RepID=A0A2S8GRU2_9BACT|nr:AI-2E family transporter [Blastopirellula marina]PQO47091.1 AI-2E family transporter [Blastopirellula marina]